MTDDLVPPGFDPELWIEVEGFDGRCYLLGNSHTHQGRMLAWIEHLGVVASVSKYEITDSSESARLWVEGFLHGNEPDPATFLGIDEVAVGLLADDDPATRRWRTALSEFHRSGTMPALVPVPTIPFPDDAGLKPVPWTWAGGQVWNWKDRSWMVADPQPLLDGGLLAGSECAARGFHEMDEFGERHLTCRVCGETAEVEG
jgi:hypothetical protein